jgi:transcriptional regulator with XRE-family HTH domain
MPLLIPFEGYERLIEAAEDAADARIATEIKRRLATGEEELISAELVDATGLAAPHISQPETGKREGSMEAFKKIATARRVVIDDIA